MQLMQKKGKGSSAAASGTTPARSSNGASLFRTAFKDVQEKRVGIPDTIPLPDEDELERVRRKRAARRTGGRSSTVLTDDNRLGG